MNRLLVVMLFVGGVYAGGLLVGPLYRTHIETQLTTQTLAALDRKGLHGVHIHYDHLSAKVKAQYEPGKVAREIDKRVWGAYVAPNAVIGSAKAPAKLTVSIDRKSNKVVLSGIVPNRSLRKSLQEAVVDSGSLAEVDNILVIDERVAPPSWESAIPAFIAQFMQTPGTVKMTLNDRDGLKLEGRVEFKVIRERLSKAGASFSKVENLLKIGKVNKTKAK